MALLNSGGIGARTDFHQRGAGEIPAPAIGLARMKRAGFRSQRKGLVKAQEGRRKQLTWHHRASPTGHRDLLCTEPPPLMCSASKSKPTCQNQALAPRAAHRMLRGIPYTGRDPQGNPLLWTPRKTPHDGCRADATWPCSQKWCQASTGPLCAPGVVGSSAGSWLLSLGAAPASLF